MRNADRQPIRGHQRMLVHGERGCDMQRVYRQTLSQGAKGRGSVQVDIDLKSFGEGLGQGKRLRARFIHMFQVCFGEKSRERSCTPECG